VCASCSPHRITIPRQFIVHPPSESIANYIDLTNDEENAMSNFGPFRNPALGGGEEVRVCNPCVPDPNFSPPPQYDTSGRGSRYPGQFPPTARSPYISRPQPPPHPRANRSSSSVQGTSQFAGQGQIHGGRDPSNDQSRRVSYHGNSNIGERRLPPLPPSAAQQQHPHHRAPLISQTMANNRPRNTQSRSNYGYGSLTGSSTFGQPTYAPVPPPLQPQRAQPSRPRRQIAEEDECPICGDELPPTRPNNDDSERAQHIQECIALHSASPGPTVALTQPTSASLPNQRTRGMSSAGNGEGASNQSRMSHAARGMFPYVATEKDCVDDDGRQAECTICLEDFEAGDKMARLVCWCKFHEVCELASEFEVKDDSANQFRSRASKSGGIRREEGHVRHINCKSRRVEAHFWKEMNRHVSLWRGGGSAWRLRHVLKRGNFNMLVWRLAYRRPFGVAG